MYLESGKVQNCWTALTTGLTRRIIHSEIIEMKKEFMIFIQKPDPTIVQQSIKDQRQKPFSYPEVGGTRERPPNGYVVDHNRVRLGFGVDTFVEAKAALRRWEMFQLGWIELCWPEAPLAVGTTVAILGQAFGLWSLNVCRIVYVIDEVGPVERFGFAYGTLPEHLERGEERFTIEWHHQDDSVWYDILAFSRPNQWLSRLSYPVIRQFQRHFARESLARMRQVVNPLDDTKYR